VQSIKKQTEYMKRQVLSVLGVMCAIAVPIVSLAQGQGAAPVPTGIGTSAPSASTAFGPASTSLSAISSPSIFDGSTNVNIPIHQFSLDNQDYGISLSYNTRGVKVDEPSTIIGTHFNMTEFAIVRVVKDLPDELSLESTDSLAYYTGATDANGEGIMAKFVNHKRFLKGKMATYTETTAQQAVANVYRDTENDDFIFSCGGRSFTFNLAKDGKVFTNPHNNIKVTPLIDGVPVFLVEGQNTANWTAGQYSGILEFQVRDEQGTRYDFIRGDYQQTPLNNNEYGGSTLLGYAWITSRWVIKKVTFANGNEINYNYSYPGSNQASSYYKQYYVKEYWSGGNPTNAYFAGLQTASGALTSCQLNNIQYPNGTQATFVYSTTNKTELDQQMLQEITISSGSQCMRYKLNQAKVNDRWFLNSVKLASCDNSQEEPYYSFEYDPLTLPRRFNSAQDYYGYYNGDSTGVGLNDLGNSTNSGAAITIPQHYTGTFNYGNDRSPNPAFAKAGILTKVRNAFGGEISFRYSGNVGAGVFAGTAVTLPVTNFMGTDAMDGLRVDSIIEKEKYHPDDARITVYEYSGGQIFMPGGYFHYPDYINGANNQWDTVIFQSMFLTAHQFIGGSNHGYSDVTVKNYNAAGQLLGRTQTTFSNMKDLYSGGQPNYTKIGKEYFQYPYTDKQYLQDWKIGLPMKTVEYDQNNRIVSQTENFFDTLTDNSAATYLTNTKKIFVNSGAGNFIGYENGNKIYYYPNRMEITDTYSPYTGRALLRCTKTKSYVTDTRFVEDSTLYAYDGNNNIKTITTQNSKGEKVNTVYVYNYEVGGPDVIQGAAPSSVLYNMTDAGLQKVVSVERWKQNTGGTFSQQLISSLINTFNYDGGILRPRSVYDLKLSEPLAYTNYTGLTQGGSATNPYGKIITAFLEQVPQYMDRTTEIKQSDAKGNPMETRVNNMELYKSMIWDTNTGKKLAEVGGAQYADIAFSGFEASNKGNLVYDEANIFAASGVPGGGISGDHVLKAMNTTAPLSHSGLTPAREYIMSFWCKNGTPVIGGAGLGTIPMTLVYAQNGWVLYNAHFTPASNAPLGFMQTGSPSSPFAYYIDDVRIYPASATMQTYNYTPLFGLSSSANANGQLTYYEYDQLGRQTIVRDQKGNIISKTKTYNAGGL
jgi:YD repeat-containing protein